MIKNLILPGLLLFIGSAHGASHYAGIAAQGLANGQSWENQWIHTAINWGSVNPGDTVFLDGGSTSKSYFSPLTIADSGSAGNPITIRPGQDSGHNGTVVLEGCGVNIQQNYVTISGEGAPGNVSKWLIRNYYNEYAEGPTVFGLSSTIGVTVKWITASNINNFAIANYSDLFTIHNNRILACGGTYAIRGLVLPATSFDRNLIYSNYIELIMNTATPPGQPYPYFGPDGVQSGAGMSFFANTVYTHSINYRYTSAEHPDVWQNNGGANWQKIYRNDFINIADSILGFGGFGGDTVYGPIQIYDNIFRCLEAIDPYPDYIRSYHNGPGRVTLYTGFKILNNLFVDQIKPWPAIDFQSTGTPTITDCEVSGNLFLNVGLGSAAINLVGNGWLMDSNYYSGVTGAINVAGYGGVPPQTALGFVSYTALNTNNNYHLSDTSTIIGKGKNFSSVFTQDFYGSTRSEPWDPGPIKSGSGGGGGGPETNAVMSVSSGAGDAGDALTNTTVFGAMFTVQNSGLGGPLTGTALLSGGYVNQFSLSNANWSLAPGASHNVTAYYSPKSPGVHSVTVLFDSNADDLTRTVSGLAGILQPTNWWKTTNMTFNGVWTSSNGMLSNLVEQGYHTENRAVTWFRSLATTNATVWFTNVAAADGGKNSFWLTMNENNPPENNGVFDITNSPFRGDLRLNWRGATGTFESPSVVPKHFPVTNGQLCKVVLLAREPVSIEIISVEMGQTAEPPKTNITIGSKLILVL